MARAWRVWTIFGACLTIVLAAVAWLSVTADALSREAVLAQRRAVFEENVRLALWRADSVVATLLARENARPYYVYKSFYPAERAYSSSLKTYKAGDVLVPSPLLSDVSPYIKLHFQFEASGTLTSPQAPTGKSREVMETHFVDAKTSERAASLLRELERHISGSVMVARLLSGLPETFEQAEAFPPSQARERDEETYEQTASPRTALLQQASRNQMEVGARGRSVRSGSLQRANVGQNVLWTNDVREGPLTPIWHDGQLFLLRRVMADEQEYLQGCWLDWPKIEEWLRRQITDLFPDARFVPTSAAIENGSERVLASLPVRLTPGKAVLGPDPVDSGVQAFLRVMWICVILAFLAVAILLFGIVSLSERRAAFVSAVTHELRTPLTTFRLYTDMLTAGLITDREKQREYLQTLHAEAVRLGHLVENVLAFARLERGRGAPRGASTTPAELLDRARERLNDRANQAGMQLYVTPLAPSVESLVVRADPDAVEQILLNLVDNACKYAIGAENRSIQISTLRSGKKVRVRVRDFGPGIARTETRRLFKPFHKSAGEAARTAPGVGLGLSISRKLARQFGGDLKPVNSADGKPGACFDLSLEIVAVSDAAH